MHRLVIVLARLLRAASLVILSIALTTALVRNAPGYLSESGEMDAGHAATAREQLRALAEQDSSTGRMLIRAIVGIAHGELGVSRQFAVPVGQLIGPRIKFSAVLLFKGILLGWLGAISTACMLAWRRRLFGNLVAIGLSAALIAVPMGAIATLCLVLNYGGPVLILALTVGVRDFKVLYRLLLQVLDSPPIEHARALGLRSYAIFSVHVRAMLRQALPQLTVTSVVVALGAMVPLEVIFDLPGVGQLAWTAAMNRDVPVLQAVTACVAACVAFSSLVPSGKVQTCAP